jgi:hypothetical protein
MKIMHMVAFILAMVGALNWGLVGIGGFAGSDWNRRPYGPRINAPRVDCLHLGGSLSGLAPRKSP